MIKKYKGIIFDLDGTLFDSMHIWKTLPSIFLKNIGIEPEIGLDEQIKDFSMHDGANYLIEKYSLNLTTSEVIKGVVSCVGNFYKNDVELKCHAREFLDFCSENEIKMCLATASERDLIVPGLERLDILKYFEQILTCSEVGAGKDSPLIYENSLEILDCDKSEVLVFEDALYAIETAKNAGFDVVYVYDESSKKDIDTIAKHTKIHITSYKELIKKG